MCKNEINIRQKKLHKSIRPKTDRAISNQCVLIEVITIHTVEIGKS